LWGQLTPTAGQEEETNIGVCSRIEVNLDEDIGHERQPPKQTGPLLARFAQWIHECHNVVQCRFVIPMFECPTFNKGEGSLQHSRARMYSLRVVRLEEVVTPVTRLGGGVEEAAFAGVRLLSLGDNGRSLRCSISK